MKFEHMGHTVSVTDHFEFSVSGPEFADARSYDSANAAREAIANRIKTAERERTVIRRVSLDALDASGNPLTIRGINRTDGTLLGGPDTDTIFPSVSWLADILRQRAALRQQIKAIDDKTVRYQIRANRAHGRIENESYYERLLQAFETELTVKTENAAKARGED